MVSAQVCVCSNQIVTCWKQANSAHVHIPKNCNILVLFGPRMLHSDRREEILKIAPVTGVNSMHLLQWESLGATRKMSSSKRISLASGPQDWQCCHENHCKTIFFKWQVEYMQVKSMQVSEREISYIVKSSSTSQWYQIQFIRLLEKFREVRVVLGTDMVLCMKVQWGFVCLISEEAMEILDPLCS